MPIYRITKPPNTKNLARDIALKAKVNWLKKVLFISGGSLTIKENRAYKEILNKAEKLLEIELSKKLKL